MTKRAGFTLIEMMITVAIIGILASVALPTFYKYKERVRDSEVEVMFSAIHRGAVSYWEEEFVTQNTVTAASVTKCVTVPGWMPADPNEIINALQGSKFFLDFGGGGSRWMEDLPASDALAMIASMSQ